MARKARNSDLKRGTHKGRSASTGSPKYSAVNNPRGIKGYRLYGDPRLSATAMTRISPTPSGPEPGHGGRMY